MLHNVKVKCYFTHPKSSELSKLSKLSKVFFN